MRPGAAEPGADMSTWPPLGATPVDIDGLYDRLAARGYGYGPAFQGLTAMWRRGDEIFADVSLPDDAGVSPAGFGVHPAVLDAALHAVIVATEADHDGKNGVLVPFSWQGVSLHAAGASSVRARIAPSGPSSVSVELADALGLPVLSVASMVARPVSRQQLMAAVSGSGPDRIFEVIWSPAAPGSHAETPSYDVFESQPADDDPLASTYRPHPRRAGRAASPGSPSTTPECCWCRRAVRSDCRGRTSPIWPVPRCGGWCARRRPSIRAGSCWWIPMRR